MFFLSDGGGVSRSGRVRKKSSKFSSDFESPEKIDIDRLDFDKSPKVKMVKI